MACPFVGFVSDVALGKGFGPEREAAGIYSPQSDHYLPHSVLIVLRSPNDPHLFRSEILAESIDISDMDVNVGGVRIGSVVGAHLLRGRRRHKLEGKVAVVTGATRGCGRGIACMLGEAGATVYCTGRSVRGKPATVNRPETIEETAEMVTARGGLGIAVQTDHTVEEQVRALFARVTQEQDGRLDLLVNDVWGGDELTEWNKPFWELSLENGFGVTEANWREAIRKDPHFAASETPFYIGRAVVALASDPNSAAKAGQTLSTWKLAEEYDFTDVDGRRPDWGTHFRENIENKP